MSDSEAGKSIRMIWASLLLAFLACACSKEFDGRGDSQGQSEKWIAGRGYSQVLDFYSDGKFKASIECDVCEKNDVVEGRWEEQGDVLSLHSMERSFTKELKRGLYKGCAALLPLPLEKEVALSNIYFKYGDDCQNEL